jgi:hypothetical protein
MSAVAGVMRASDRKVECLLRVNFDKARKRSRSGSEVALGLIRMTDWYPIVTAPFDRDLQLAVIEKGEVHSLVFSCQRADGGWANATTAQPVFVDPTHWREWSD